jgi:hypothetical protein
MPSFSAFTIEFAGIVAAKRGSVSNLKPAATIQFPLGLAILSVLVL